MKRFVILLTVLLMLPIGWTAGENILLPEWTRGLETWWASLAPMEESRGVYAGDLFEIAYRKQSANLKWGDLALMIDLMEHGAEDNKEGPLADVLPAARIALLEAAKNHTELFFEAEVYPEVGCVVLTVYCAEGTVMTVSCRMDVDRLVLVVGSAENGKTYYREYVAVPASGDTYQVNVRYLADDLGVGYPRLTEDALIVETSVTVPNAPAELLKLITEPSLSF